jgi:phospho-N-acetylmuramoyl-pentapeptide-transferase
LIGREIDFGMFYGLFGVLVIVSAGNGVNLTDGLDGLATGTTLVSLSAFLFIAGQFGSLAGMPRLTPAVLAWIGSLVGFLFYNRHPAKVFMGDTGSNALGALLAGLAILTRTEILLLLIAGIPVIETVSDILQVASFQLTGKRIFKMAPLHHHFELSGWGETTIVWTFWLVQVVLAYLGIAAMTVFGAL